MPIESKFPLSYSANISTKLVRLKLNYFTQCIVIDRNGNTLHKVAKIMIAFSHLLSQCNGFN